jgi:4a-hydroxytetrahydrobiopterin dehydratase
MDDLDAPLSRTASSEAVEAMGWRHLLGTLCTSVAVSSLEQAAQVAQFCVSVAGQQADRHLRLDLRPDRVELSLQTRSNGTLTSRDVTLARQLSATVATLGYGTGGATSSELERPVQMFEIAIDAIDIPRIRPFWKAVLGYVDESPNYEIPNAIVDPTGQLPCVWFQQMDEPRTDRNRIHFDITVAHDEAAGRIQAALEAGGVLVSDAAARSFWILADADGNEVCVCTWQDRDQREIAEG